MLFKRNIWAAMLAVMLLAGTNVSAQVIYSCDFENAAENANWTLNRTANSRPIANYKNNWYIGLPGNCAGGANGLYIASRSDTTANKAAVVATTEEYLVAYRDTINLGAVGSYILSFDWKALGKSNDYLYVYWFPSTYTNNTNSNYGGAGVPAAWAPYKIAEFRGSPLWQSYYANFTSSTATGKLAFVWYQKGGGVINPPAAVDNIDILSPSTSCTQPTGLTYNPAGTISWNGSASVNSYDVRYCNTHSGEWQEVKGVSATTQVLQNISEGTYTFQVRTNCSGGGHSAWTSISQFIWVKGLRCIDFFDYGASLNNAGVCFVGEHTNSSSHSSLVWEPLPRMVDNGPASDASMHTLHTQIGEIDPNTTVDGGLRTIPEGEIASIRLGAYTSSGQDARIEYRYKVQSGMSDLLDLSYACVLESGGHDADNPFFQLDILDQNGQQIDGCTHAYFVADMSGTSGSGWHQEGDIFWCDWRTVTVSLTQFIGQTLTIRLTSSRCVFDTHFGYAYFTLNCRGGGLQGIACGDFTTDHFTAPSGFDYEWYKLSNPGTILGTDSIFHIANNDTALYAVKVKSQLTDGCYYVLTANPNPRFPELRATRTITQKDCQNYARFTQKSGVVYVNRVDSSTTVSEEEVEDIYWDFGDGTPILHSKDTVVEHVFPQSGGTFIVRIGASMSEGSCVDEEIFTLNLPELGDKRVETVVPYCYDGKTPYIYNGVSHYESFQDSAVYRLSSDCDSTDVIKVNFTSTVTSELYDTICHEVYNYTYNGTVYPEAGDYPVQFISYLGCDSIVTLHLYKHPQPQIKVDSAFAYCADELFGMDIPYLLTDQDLTVDRIEVVMDDEAVENGFAPSYSFSPGEQLHISWPSDISPNIYQGKVVFSSQTCISYSYGFKLELSYPSATLDQKNGVVAIMNDDYNGGYSFASYQWYRNGERLEGETKSYVRVSDEEDMNAEYYVVVLRNEDNVVLRTCPIIYTGGGWRDALENVTEESKVVKIVRDGNLFIIRDGVWYTVLGTVMKHEQ